MTLPALPAVLPLPAYDAPPSVSIPESRAAWESLRAFRDALSALLPLIDEAGASAAADAIDALVAGLPVQTVGADPLGLSGVVASPSSVTVTSDDIEWVKTGRDLDLAGRFIASFGAGGSGMVEVTGLPAALQTQTAVSITLFSATGLNIRTGAHLMGVAQGTVIYLHDELGGIAQPVTFTGAAGSIDALITLAAKTAA